MRGGGAKVRKKGGLMGGSRGKGEASKWQEMICWQRKKVTYFDVVVVTVSSVECYLLCACDRGW